MDCFLPEALGQRPSLLVGAPREHSNSRSRARASISENFAGPALRRGPVCPFRAGRACVGLGPAEEC